MMDYHLWLVIFFIIGYFFLILEHSLLINKAAIALITGIVSWGIYLNFDPAPLEQKFSMLSHHTADIAQVLLFLVGAMTIVEMISSHNGFNLIRNFILISSPRKLYWVLLWLGFWLSSVLDNLTTILVLVSLIRQVVPDKPLRQLFCAGLVFAVNVGGAWTPIGDITTTMLWIEDRVNTIPLIVNLLIPSVLSLAVFGFLFSWTIPRDMIHFHVHSTEDKDPLSKPMLLMGIAGLLLVPVLKVVFNLPPFMGMMASLGVLWVVTDRIHKKKDNRKVLKVDHILTKIDISCVLFFLGILLAVDALEAAGILDWLATQSNEYIANRHVFALVIGIISSIIDNVPLVAALIKMFDLSAIPADNFFWHQVAYCAGVGGSLLIIGSAPGVALMSLKDIRFFWYLKRVSWVALIAYLCGWGAVVLLNKLGLAYAAN